MVRRWLILLLPPFLAGLLALAVHHASALQASQSLHLPLPKPRDWGGPLPGDTTLHPADNPHIVNDHLIVPSGVTLTILPSVELHFAPGVSLIVYGRLLAEGAPTATIRFTHRDQGSYWGAIAIIDSPADNRITHAVIEYTREGLSNPRSHGVTAYNSRLTLADSTLRYTQDSAGVTAYWNSTLYLLRNEIHDVRGDAVHPTGGVAVIQGNHIYNVGGGSQPNEGIEISDMPSDSPALLLDNHVHDVTDECLDLNDASAVIERNHLHHCADKGISIGSAGQGSSPVFVTVVNNLIYASHIGIAVKDRATAHIVHNTIADNEGDGLTLYEDHIGFGGGRATMVNTILWDNGQSISLDTLSVLTVTYSDVQGGWFGEGNLDVDPAFQAVGDYHLGAGSPAINAGQDQGVAVDLEGQPRPIGNAPDVGAYERQSLLDLSAWPGDERIYLAWQSSINDPTLASFAISYTARLRGSVVLAPTWLTGLSTTALTFTLTDLVNYAWYTVEVEGWDADGGVLTRSNLVAVMPTDRYVYLPLTLCRHP